MTHGLTGRPSNNPAGGPTEHMRNTPVTNEQIAEALRASHAVYGDAAKYITRKYGRKTRRGLISERVNRYPELKKLVGRIRDSATDYVEKRMWGRIEQGDPRMIAFYLNTFGKDRGYGAKREERVEGEFKIEITGSDANL
jgi:hypothetical protein